MSTFISILMTILILNVIVVVHEFGHYITAKKFGVGIKEFSIGMGPAIYQKQKKEHRFVFFRKSKMFPEDEFKFSIRALPIGGFVNLKGEEETSEDPDSFSKLKAWKKLVVFLAGAFMNMVLGIVCIVPWYEQGYGWRTEYDNKCRH
jgi:regulator of sigma E protease